MVMSDFTNNNKPVMNQSNFTSLHLVNHEWDFNPILFY